MNSLIKYGLYFVVAFSVLAFGAAEDGKDRSQKSEVRSQKGKSKRSADYADLEISHRHTQTDTDSFGQD